MLEGAGEGQGRGTENLATKTPKTRIIVLNAVLSPCAYIANLTGYTLLARSATFKKVVPSTSTCVRMGRGVVRGVELGSDLGVTCSPLATIAQGARLLFTMDVAESYHLLRGLTCLRFQLASQVS